MKTIDVFHKDKKPSLETLAKVKEILESYKDHYAISYYLITDPNHTGLIRKYNLPDTHFPFAVVIDGKFSARINNRKIDFVHFPTFMHGIGRHEGNWSLIDLAGVLADTTLLLPENVLPELETTVDGPEPCPE